MTETMDRFEVEFLHSGDAIGKLLPDLKVAQEILDSLDDNIYSESEVLIDLLNKKWGIQGQPVELTGRLYRVEVNEGDEESDTELPEREHSFESVFAEDISGVSAGFVVKRFPTSSEAHCSTKPTIVHEMHRARKLKPRADVIVNCTEVYYSLPEDIEVKPVNKPDIDLLEFTAPDLLEEIDLAILNSTNINESLQQLSTLSISSIKLEPNLIIETEKYINSLMEIDSEIPYLYEGDGLAFTSEGSIQETQIKTSAVSKHRMIPYKSTRIGKSAIVFLKGITIYSEIGGFNSKENLLSKNNLKFAVHGKVANNDNLISVLIPLYKGSTFHHLKELT